MKPDQTSRTESAARDAANLAGRVEDFGGGVGVPPVTTPYCSVCQRGTSGYVCGPCARDAEIAEQHEHTREEVGRVVRVACSCGWRGKWRSRTSILLERQLHSDDGEHLYAVRRGEA